MRRGITTALMGFTIFLTLSSAASAVDAKTDYDHSVNFEKYRTFAWKNYGATSDGIVKTSALPLDEPLLAGAPWWARRDGPRDPLE